MNVTLPADILEMKRKARVFVDEKCIPLEKELEPDWIELPSEIHNRLAEKIKSYRDFGVLACLRNSAA